MFVTVLSSVKRSGLTSGLRLSSDVQIYQHIEVKGAQRGIVRVDHLVKLLVHCTNNLDSNPFLERNFSMLAILIDGSESAFKIRYWVKFVFCLKFHINQNINLLFMTYYRCSDLPWPNS